MKHRKQCPFCGQPISAAQYAELHERIRKAEDPAILQELEIVREEISEELRKNLETEYAPLRKQLDAYLEKEKTLNELSTQLALRKRALDAEVSRKIKEKEKELIAAGVQRAKEELQSLAEEKDKQIKGLTATNERLNREMDKRVASLLQDREQQLRDEERKRVEEKYGTLQQKLRKYQQEELELERTKQALALREDGLELEIQKRLSAGRDGLFKEAGQQARELYEMEAKERDRTIQTLKQQVNQLHERLQSGSPQVRGYIQQEDLANFLRELYPNDEITEIKRGVHGADILHRVRLHSGVLAGLILWESKRTKDFHAGWIDKLREDQRDQKADIAVLVSQVLPEEINHFAVRGDVVLAHPTLVDQLSGMVRQYLVNLARQKITTEQRETKVQDLYNYMTGKEFQQRIAGIVEAAANLQELVDREVRSHERLWAQRRKLHGRVVRQSALLYGEIAGIVGTLPPVSQLELPAPANEIEEANEEPTGED